jgi:hypothetical protein
MNLFQILTEYLSVFLNKDKEALSAEFLENFTESFKIKRFLVNLYGLRFDNSLRVVKSRTK